MTLDKEWLIISTITHIKTFRPRYYRKVTTVHGVLTFADMGGGGVSEMLTHAF